MKPFAPKRVAAAALLLVAVLPGSLAGCAGGGGSTAAPPSSPPASPVATSAASASAAATATPAPTPDVQGLLDEVRANYGAPGALVVLEKDAARWFATSGAADLDGTEITETTRFRIASITKTIVATLVLDAVAQEKLSLDDVFGKLLPGVLRAEPPVTVRQLLDHTSGIFDWINAGDPADIEKIEDPALRAEAEATLKHYEAGERVIASDRVIVALAETHDRYFAPGTDFFYSNTNYQLAAMVLEEVTGTPLAGLLRTRIVEPLSLRHTTIAPPDLGSPELRGYGKAPADPELVDLTDDLVFAGNGGDGGIVASADDLLVTMRAILSGELLPAPLLTEMMTPSKLSYGLGLMAVQTPCGIYFGHAGISYGTTSLALVSPNGADGVVIAMNLQADSPANNPNLQALADQLLCPGT
jgi:D-alanyl-D-alanine carboxypeptidase